MGASDVDAITEAALALPEAERRRVVARLNESLEERGRLEDEPRGEARPAIVRLLRWLAPIAAEAAAVGLPVGLISLGAREALGGGSARPVLGLFDFTDLALFAFFGVGGAAAGAALVARIAGRFPVSFARDLGVLAVAALLTPLACLAGFLQSILSFVIFLEHGRPELEKFKRAAGSVSDELGRSPATTAAVFVGVSLPLAAGAGLRARFQSLRGRLLVAGIAAMLAAGASSFELGHPCGDGHDGQRVATLVVAVGLTGVLGALASRAGEALERRLHPGAPPRESPDVGTGSATPARE